MSDTEEPQGDERFNVAPLSVEERNAIFVGERPDESDDDMYRYEATVCDLESRLSTAHATAERTREENERVHAENAGLWLTNEGLREDVAALEHACQTYSGIVEELRATAERYQQALEETEVLAATLLLALGHGPDPRFGNSEGVSVEKISRGPQRSFAAPEPRPLTPAEARLVLDKYRSPFPAPPPATPKSSVFRAVSNQELATAIAAYADVKRIAAEALPADTPTETAPANHTEAQS